MTSQPSVAALSALLLLGAAAPALASPFTLNPKAVKLNGTKFTADTFVLSDDAQIRFGNNGTTFVDTGYLSVIGFRLDGQAVSPAGYGAKDGSGWGAYISYTGTGTQILGPQGPVSATFKTLSYTVVGYNGLASFGFAPDGSATVGGAIRDVTPLGAGSLITGQLAFTLPPGQAAPTIIGQVRATADEIKPQFIQSKPSAFDVTFIHPPGEYFFSSATTLQIVGGTSSSATLEFGKDGSGSQTDATVPLPEPASAALLGAGLLGLAARAARRRMGQ